MLKKGEKLGTFEDEMNGSSQEQLAAALKDQGELSPELLQVRTEPSPSQAKPSQAKPSTPSRLLSPAKPRQAHMPPPLDPPSLADLSPSLVFCYLQALLEAQQLGAVMGQASAQARGGPKGGSSSLTEVEEGSAADHAAAAARDAVTEATPLTEADHKYLAQAEKAADKADKEKGKEKRRRTMTMMTTRTTKRRMEALSYSSYSRPV